MYALQRRDHGKQAGFEPRFVWRVATRATRAWQEIAGDAIPASMMPTRGRFHAFGEDRDANKWSERSAFSSNRSPRAEARQKHTVGW